MLIIKSKPNVSDKKLKSKPNISDKKKKKIIV